MKFSAHKNRFTFAILFERPCMLEYITFAGSSDSSAQMRTELGARSGNSRVKGIAPSPVEVV